MSMNEVALRRALVLLNTLGCQYAVVTPDGEQYGELVVKPPAKRRRTGIDYAATGYIEKLRAMTPGEIARIPIPPSIAPGRYQSVICSSAMRFFGKGNYITHQVDGFIEVLRLKNEPAIH